MGWAVSSLEYSTITTNHRYKSRQPVSDCQTTYLPHITPACTFLLLSVSITMTTAGQFPPQPISYLPSELLASLRGRTLAVLSYLVKTNSISTYFNDAGSLSAFRDALGLTAHGQLNSDLLSNPDLLFNAYHDSVTLTDDRNYRPFVSRFFEQPCKTSSVENLMAPGMPFFIVHSSGTSGGTPKCYPKYRHPEHMSTSTSHVMTATAPVSKSGGKNCLLYSLVSRQVVTSLGDDGEMDRGMPVCIMSTGTVRMFNDMVNLGLLTTTFYVLTVSPGG